MISHIAPGLAERQAAKLFITPRLRKTPSPTELHASLLPERAMERRAGEAEAAYPTLATGRVALWSWGRGPTVLLVHGWAGAAGDMAPLAAALVRGGYRAVLFDMPGHGGSAPGTTNLFVYIQTLAALGELVGPIDTVIGHSLGGTAVAVALGDELLSARRAVLLAPALSPWAFSWHFAQIIGLPKERVPGMVRVTEALVGRKADTLNAAEAAAGLEIPAQIVHDPDDLDVPFEQGQRLAAAWKGAEFIARPGVGHRRILRDAETVAGVVEFVSGEALAPRSPAPQGASRHGALKGLAEVAVIRGAR